MEYLMRIGAVAERFGVSADTIARWEEEGVLPPAVRVGKKRERRWPESQIREIAEHGFPGPTHFQLAPSATEAE